MLKIPVDEEVQHRLTLTYEDIFCALAPMLCTEDVDTGLLTDFLSCRLVLLDKEGGKDRPVEIGKVWRRIVSKSVKSLLKDDIQEAAGTLQTFSGVELGIEAAVHSMRKTFVEDSSEAMLLVDTTNAFKSLNRGMALHNIEQICPTFHCFLNNCYKNPSNLFVNRSKSKSLSSKEGATQGDPVAMQMFAVGSRPMIYQLAHDKSSMLTMVLQVVSWILL